MATKLNGRLNLSKIPSSLIQTGKDGNKYIFIDVLERKAVGKYGETHTVTTYDKANRQTIYLADLAPQEFGAGTEQKTTPQKTEKVSAPTPVQNDDLPF